MIAVRPATAHPNVTLWTGALCPPADRGCPGRQGRGGRARAERRDRTRLRDDRHRLVRRRQLRRAAAALGVSHAPRRPGEFLRTRRPPLHGAPGDDAGGRALEEERRRVPEDAGDQRLLPGRRGRAVSARQDPVAGTDARDHGQGHRRHLALQGHRDALDSAVGLRRMGVARHRLAGDDRGPAGSRTIACASRRTAASCSSTGRTTRGRTGSSSSELRTILQRLGYWSPKAFAHSAGARNTTHQCGTLVFGTDPRASVLDPFCRTHDVENLFVVDASFFPSSAAVNPGLTIAAQALRVADHIMQTCQPP